MAFNNAHNFGIGSNATFNLFQPQAPWPMANPAEILDQARAVEATHISATASYATKCNPETRLKVIGDIADWVVGPGANEDATPRKLILWFSGPAGAGKTTIMRDVVDRCGAAGLSALSYFFSTRAGLKGERPFVATIVHQLAALDPVLKPMIYHAIQDYPTIFKESLDFQMDRLLVEPLQSDAFRSQEPSPRKIVIAIDGLDECSEEPEREHLLNLLRSLVNKLPQLIVAIVASRPEFDLRRAFDDPSLSSITKVLKLQEYDGTKDIRVFLCDEFARIRATHFLKKSIPENWPPEEIIVILLNKSSGNFIYPATVIKYIKGSRRNPVESLDIILGLSNIPPTSTSNPFTELDALYSLILHPPDTDLPLVKRILHCILGITSNGVSRGDFLSPSFFDSFLGLPPNTTATTLCDLHSILSIPDSDDEAIQFHHKTLEDYLLDPKRSLDFFQSLYETHLDLARVCIKNGRRWAKSPVFDKSSYLEYSSLCWDDHLLLCIQNRLSSTTIPGTDMDVDPAILLKYRFSHCDGLFNYTKLRVCLHETLCSKGHCVPLCGRLTHIDKCWKDITAFDLSFTRDTKERHKALPRFESETGLDKHPGRGDKGDHEGAMGKHSSSPNFEAPRLSLTVTTSPPDDSGKLSFAVHAGPNGPNNPPLRRPSFEGEAGSSSLTTNSSLSTPSIPVPKASRTDRLGRHVKRWFGRSRSPSRS